MRIARSGVGWLVAKYGALGASFLATFYFTRALDDPTRTLGLFSVFLTLVSVVTLVVGGGIGKALTVRISERPEESEAFVGAAGLIVAVLLLVAGVVVTAGSGLVADYFGAGRIVAPIILATGAVVAVSNYAGSVLNGYGLVGRSGALATVDSSSRAVVQSVLVASGVGFLGLTVGAAVGTGVGALVGIVLVVYATPLRPWNILDAGVEHLQSLVSFVRVAVFQSFASKFYDEVDIVVIAALIGPAAVSLYAIPFRLTLALDIASGAVSRASLPAVSRHAAAGEDDRVKEILTDGVVFGTGLAIPATVGTFVLARPLMVTLFTPAFAESAAVAGIIVAIQVPDGIRSVLASIADGIDRPVLALRASLVLVVINLVLDIILVPTFGIEGAAVASLVGMTLATAVLGHAVMTELDLSLEVFPIRAIAEEIGSALVMGILVYGLRVTLSLPQRIEVVLLVFVGVVSYLSLLLIFGREVRPRVLGIAVDVLPRQLSEPLQRRLD